MLDPDAVPAIRGDHIISDHDRAQIQASALSRNPQPPTYPSGSGGKGGSKILAAKTPVFSIGSASRGWGGHGRQGRENGVRIWRQTSPASVLVRWRGLWILVARGPWLGRCGVAGRLRIGWRAFTLRSL